MAATAGPAPAAVGRAFLCVALATLLAGCSLVADIRREPPQPSAPVDGHAPPTRPPSNEWLVERRPDVVDVRVPRVAIPADFDRQTVEFSDARHGAALFTRCGVSGPRTDRRESCTARLLTTDDGGRTWRERKHPRPVADNQRMYLGEAALLLLAEPYAWYLSRDGGQDFRSLPYRREARPPEYHVLFGRFQVCCDGDSPARVVEWTNAGARPVPTAPPLPGVLAAARERADRDLWAASIDDGRAYTAVSTDGGRGWRRTEIPGAEGGLERLSLMMSADRADVWLLGFRKDQARFPAVWRFDPGGWRQMAAIGHPEAFTSAAPIGGGLLAMSGPLATGLVGERYTATDWPSGGWIHLLGDGTLSITDERDGSVWLGDGEGTDRRWAQVQLQHS
jgi:hypothetical protein